MRGVWTWTEAEWRAIANAARQAREPGGRTHGRYLRTRAARALLKKPPEGLRGVIGLG